MKSRWIIAAAAALSLGLLTLPMLRGSGGESVTPGAEGEPGKNASCAAEGRASFDFVLKNQLNAPVKLADFKGKVAIVNFWATWCLPCRREIPALVALQDRYRGRVVVVGVVDDSASDEIVRRFASTLQVNYPVIRTSMDLNRRFPSVEALPTTVLVDARGRVAVAYAGELQMEELERDIQRLMATASGAAVPRG